MIEVLLSNAEHVRANRQFLMNYVTKVFDSKQMFVWIETVFGKRLAN